MRVWRVVIFDGIKVEKPSRGYTLLFEDLLACPLLGIIRQEPRGTDGDDARGVGDLGRHVLTHGVGELFGRDDVGGEGDISTLCHEDERLREGCRSSGALGEPRHADGR